MQPREAPYCTQLQQEVEEEEGGHGDEAEGRGEEEKESLLMTAGEREYLDEDGNPCLLFKLPQHVNRPSQLELCIITKRLQSLY